MQPLDDFNPEIYNYPPALTMLEFVGVIAIVFIVALACMYIMEK